MPKSKNQNKGDSNIYDDGAVRLQEDKNKMTFPKASAKKGKGKS